ncbi:MAG: peptide deformylase [Chloroflexi bacterium]|nr:peptide deformylase [Chloroflexota bacterium]MBV9547035.1 peptide deformylase [Chloroflexota bacterium]
MIRPILVVGNPVLRQKAKRVSQIDRPIQRLIDDLIETMKAAPGVGLAAPQVGVPLRLAVIEVDEKITVIVNPEIVKTSGENELDEGCLSVPGFWGRLPRAERVSVKALDRNGKDFRIRDAEGLFAQALQHEIDHLDGHLYIDRMESLDTLQRSEPLRKREADARAARGESLESDEEDEPA